VREAKDKREKLNAELLALIQELRKTYPLYVALHYPQPLPARDLPLQENEVLLEYALGEKASYVFVVRKGGVQGLHSIPLGKEALEGKVKDFMVPFLNPGQADFSDKRARELYDLLLAHPLAQIKTGEQLIIVPDGILGLLPFEALVMQESKGDQKRVFMGDQHTPVYYQSATVLALQRRLQKAKPPRSLFALGNPIYNARDKRYVAYKQGKPAPQLMDRDKKQYSLQALASDKKWGKTMSGDKTGKTLDFDPLPETEPMVKNIATTWGIPPAPPDVLLGVQANETHMRQAPLQEYQYLLYATHADTSGKVQGKSEPFILLGQVENEGKDDGFLTLNEVLDLKIQAQMVALCACLTGRGKVMEGEGVVNFARAFQHAGARSVLVGLWEARSKVAAAYMEKFFGCLKDGKSRTEALRQARREVKKRWGDDPYLWAVFILHGEG
jgi:CHAT domain-containing protein